MYLRINGWNYCVGLSPDKNKTQLKDSLIFETNNELAGIAGIHSDGYRSATVRMDK